MGGRFLIVCGIKLRGNDRAKITQEIKLTNNGEEKNGLKIINAFNRMN